LVVGKVAKLVALMVGMSAVMLVRFLVAVKDASWAAQSAAMLVIASVWLKAEVMAASSVVPMDVDSADGMVEVKDGRMAESLEDETAALMVEEMAVLSVGGKVVETVDVSAALSV
jgi:hypothetical protein